MKRNICKDCSLFNAQENTCKVTVLLNGAKFNLTVEPYDSCHWERLEEEVREELEEEINHQKIKYFREKLITELDKEIEVQEIKVWSDGKNGYIEYPENQTRGS